MPKSHKPSERSQFVLLPRKKMWKKEYEEFWKSWDPTKVESILVVPRTIASFSRFDPRKSEWRRTMNVK